MIGWLIALSVLFLITFISTGIVLYFLRAAEKELLKYQTSFNAAALENQALSQQLDAQRDQIVALDNQRTTERLHLEAVIENLKKEIENLEKDLYQVRDPAVIRDRLRRLLAFSVPESGSGRTPGYGQLPYGSTSKR